MVSSTEIVHVQLLSEGTVCFRPVPAMHLGGNVFQLGHPDWYDPVDEEWEFLPGAIVECEVRGGESESIVVAIREHGS
jgi:hypothetical protein